MIQRTVTVIVEDKIIDSSKEILRDRSVRKSEVQSVDTDGAFPEPTAEHADRISASAFNEAASSPDR